MKLQALIKPRKDGSVLSTGLDGKTYKFSADESGDLVCDVDHEPTVANLLRTENFTPIEESDFGVAANLSAEPIDQDDDDESDPDALPVEANTPVRRKPGPKPKAK